MEYFQEETIVLEDLKAYYYDCKRQLDAKTQILDDARNRLLELSLECKTIIKQEIKTNINRLKKIILNIGGNKSMESFIDELIKSEKKDHKDGWQTRIKDLYLMKKLLIDDFKEITKFVDSFPNEKFQKFKILVENIKSDTTRDNLEKFSHDINSEEHNCFIY